MFCLLTKSLKHLSSYNFEKFTPQLARVLFSSNAQGSSGLYIPTYTPKPGESIGEKKARLLYQSRKRGMLENDLLLSTFADKYLIDMNDELTTQYDKLINCPYSDWDIYYWILGSRPMPSEFDNEIMKLLKEHLQNKKKEQRFRQPDLPDYVFDK